MSLVFPGIMFVLGWTIVSAIIVVSPDIGWLMTSRWQGVAKPSQATLMLRRLVAVTFVLIGVRVLYYLLNV